MILYNSFLKKLSICIKKRISPILFNLGLVLLPIKINSILKKQSCKKYTLIVFVSSSLEIVFLLLTKIIEFYMQVFIV